MTTAPPQTSTDIANLAMDHLGEDPVENIDPADEDSKPAEAAARWYDQARRDALESHPWAFAKKMAEIDEDATAPDFGYEKRFLLPDDYVRLVRIGADWDTPELDYEIFGDETGLYLHCNAESPMQLVYIFDQTDISRFSPKFVTHFSYKLAGYIGYTITKNVAVKEAMEGLAADVLAEAQVVAGQNRPPRRIQRSRLADARRQTGRYKDYQRWGDE